MTDRSESTRAARAGGLPLARVGLLALLATVAGTAGRAQTTWEMLPFVPTFGITQQVPAVGFLRGEGPADDDPAADSLVLFHEYGVFLYNPSGAGGAAGPNGEYGPWHRLCVTGAGFCGAADGLVTAAGTLIMSAGALQPSRATGRGRVWTYNYDVRGFYPYFESALPALRGPTGAPALFAGSGDGGETSRSLADGAPGTWVDVGSGFGYPQAFGDVPPSAALPNGRILLGVWNGVLTSDDGGLSYQPSSAFGQGRYIAYSFTFLPVAGHPYGGVAYAGLESTALFPGARAEVHRSDDGGRTWALAHRFTAAEMALPVPTGTDVSNVIVLATSDGALWAGVSQSGGAGVPRRGGVMRSVDGGATWERADAGFRDGTNRGYAVNQFRLSRTGVLYAATERGVWRTTGAVVAGESSPVSPSSEVGLSVRPNPAGGRVEVVVSLAEGGPVRVVVVDALGREVAVVLDGEAAGERVVGVDVSEWPAGVYVVRAEASGRSASARLVVAR